jgi:hypothetical protein
VQFLNILSFTGKSCTVRCFVFGRGDGPTGCCKVARGGCVLALNFGVTLLTAFYRIGEKTLDQTCQSLH